MYSIFRLLLDDSPVIIDGRLLHAGRTGIGRITKLMIDTASKSKTVYVLGTAGEIEFEKVIYLNTRCQKFGLTFILQNLFLNLLFFKKIKIIFPHYFSAFCFLRKLVFVHDVMAITDYKRFYLRFALLKKLVLTAVVRLGLINADVACPSKFSCKTVETLFGVSAEYLPNGTSLDVSSQKMKPDLESTVELNAIPRPFIVGYVGNKRPHKNLPDLMQFCSLNGFVLQFFDEFEPGTDHDDNLLSKFYSQVHAVALFSYCEGFGIPIIEGALFGKYIFCSKIPAFLELSDIGINFVDSKTLVTNIIKPNPLLIDQNYRFQKMKSHISSYIH